MGNHAQLVLSVALASAVGAALFLLVSDRRVSDELLFGKAWEYAYGSPAQVQSPSEQLVNQVQPAFMSSMQRYQNSQAMVMRREEQLSDAQHRLMSITQQLSGAPSYQQPPSGVSYSPASSVGVSSEDRSPDMPKGLILDEAHADKRMKHLKSMLTKSEAQQAEIDKKIKGLNDFIQSELSDVKLDVRETNTRLSDNIASASHDVRGPPGPPGVPGKGAVVLSAHTTRAPRASQPTPHSPARTGPTDGVR